MVDSPRRLAEINEFTRNVDATRHCGVGGNLENFPRRAITLGMRQCLGARKMRNRPCCIYGMVVTVKGIAHSETKCD